MISVWEWFLWYFFYVLRWCLSSAVIPCTLMCDDSLMKWQRKIKNKKKQISHRWAQQANTAPNIGKKCPIISLELQTIVLNLFNWKRLLSFQFCIAVILYDFSFEGISICRVSCVFIANFGVEYVECIIKLYIVIKHWTGPDDDSC